MSGNSYLWCRVFFVFGPGQQKTRLIPQIIKNVISQKGELLINTNLVRDYLSTFEISKQILLMSQSNFSGPLNICSGKGKSIGEIVKLIEDIIGRRAIISDKKFDDKFEVQILCGCQKEILDYFPDYEYDKKKLTKDLRTTVNYYLEEYNK
jgi:nucleoside-diphosphate-sugar epimerase